MVQPSAGAQQAIRFKGLGSQCDGCGKYALETRARGACKQVVYCRCVWVLMSFWVGWRCWVEANMGPSL